MIAFVKLLS